MRDSALFGSGRANAGRPGERAPLFFEGNFTDGTAHTARDPHLRVRPQRARPPIARASGLRRAVSGAPKADAGNFGLECRPGGPGHLPTQGATGSGVIRERPGPVTARASPRGWPAGR